MVSRLGLEHNVIEGLLIHHHPYPSDTIFNVLDLVNMRDSVTARLGARTGPRIVHDRATPLRHLDLMPNGTPPKLDGRFAYLMDGLFGMEGAKMGGPFVSLSTVGEGARSLITVEGFVYAPQFNKREYVRELEGILFSLRLDAKCIPLNPKE